MSRQKYFNTLVGSRAMNEINDCGVKACAITARVPYEAAWVACRREGRRDRHGMRLFALIDAIKSLGCNVEEIPTPRQPNGSGYTCKTIGKALKRGYYLVYVNKHFLAVVNGQVQDWSYDTNKRVKFVFKVTVPRGSRS